MPSVLGSSQLRPALLAVATLVVALLAPASLGVAPAAGAAPCTNTKLGKVSITSKHKQTWFRTYRTASGQTTQSETETRRKGHRLGRIGVELITCKRDGKWEVFDVDVNQKHRDVELTVRSGKVTKVKPLHLSNGFVLTHRKTGQKSVLVQAQRCYKKPAKLTKWKALKGLLRVPVPGPYSVSVGKFATSLLLPDAAEDKYWCHKVGSGASIPLGIKANGTPYLKWGKLTNRRILRLASLTYAVPCGASNYVYCGDTWHDTVTIFKPRS